MKTPSARSRRISRRLKDFHDLVDHHRARRRAGRGEPRLRRPVRDRRGPGDRRSPCGACPLLGNATGPRPLHRASGEPAHRASRLPARGRPGSARRPLPHGDRRPVPAVMLLAFLALAASQSRGRPEPDPRDGASIWKRRGTAATSSGYMAGFSNPGCRVRVRRQVPGRLARHARPLYPRLWRLGRAPRHAPFLSI